MGLGLNTRSRITTPFYNKNNIGYYFLVYWRYVIVITIDLGNIEYFDDAKNEFIYDEGGIVRFEYSLKVLYDWESKWKKPFLKGELTEQELIDFYMMMALDPIEERFLTSEVMSELAEYIQSTNTATTFATSNSGQNDNNFSNRSKIYTSEELYALMISAGVPIEFENRNLNRLFIILKIIGTYNNPPKKMNKQDILKQNSNLNAQRKAMMKTRG